MLRKMHENEFQEIYSMMRDAFPIDERRSFEEQKKLLTHKRFRTYVYESDGKICAFMAVWVLDGYVYVEHFVVKPEYRDRGLGGKMLSELSAIFKERIALEAEPPADDTSRRRIAFYERNGFSLNDYDYRQPAMARGRKEVPLKVMSTGGKLTPEQFEQFRRDVYATVHNII